MALIFPTLPGRGWSVTKTLTNQTRVLRGDSGRELRMSDYLQPVWRFELTHEFLRGPATTGSTAGGIPSEAPILHNFYGTCRGPWLPFFFDDPVDDQVGFGFLGVSNGTQTAYQLQRYIGDPSLVTNGFYEAITAPKIVTAIYFDGALQSGSLWSLDPTRGIVNFATAPAFGVTITADFLYWFRCRFASSLFTLEEFMHLFHGVTSLVFVSAQGDLTPAPGPQ